MEEQITSKKPVFKPALQSGIIMGLILVILSIITYFAGIMTASYMQWVTFGTIIIGIFYFARRYREDVMGGQIKYARAFGFSMFLMLFAGLITAIYTFIFYKIIDPTMLEKLVELSEENMYAQGVPDEQIDAAIEMTRRIMNPVYLSLIALINTMFFSFLISLIVSIFVMKKDKSIKA